MKSITAYGIGAVLVTIAVLWSSACGGGGSNGPPTDGTEDASRTDEGGGVTVEVTWNGELQPVVFDIVMDTHSVELDGYDLARLAVLRTDRGNELTPLAWEAPKGGHHRTGTLSFEGASARTELAGASYLELVIRDVGGVPERTFHWDLAQTAKGGA